MGKKNLTSVRKKINGYHDEKARSITLSCIQMHWVWIGRWFQSAVLSHFKTVLSQVVAGKPFNLIIEIGGQRVQYTAFKFSDGTFNIGRIYSVK